jgi:hypothetical protein
MVKLFAQRKHFRLRGIKLTKVKSKQLRQFFLSKKFTQGNIFLKGKITSGGVFT